MRAVLAEFARLAKFAEARRAQQGTDQTSAMPSAVVRTGQPVAEKATASV
jgi:hypothetical protein